MKDRRRYTFAEYEQIRLRDDEVDRKPVNGEQHPEGQVAFLGIDGERRMYNA